MSLLFPKRCPICDSVIKSEEEICRECIRIPRRIEEPRCLKCGKHIEDPKEEFCFDCSKEDHVFKRGIALYEYDSIKDSINNFKNAGRPEYASFYAKRMVKYLGRTIKDFHADALIPIPLHVSKLRKRGYNQSEILAEELSKLTGIPVRSDLLIRNKRTKDQKKQSKEQRQKNMVGAFHMPQNGVKLYNIILVDDVYTTGATIDEAAKVLMDGGIANVYFLTVAMGIDE